MKTEKTSKKLSVKKETLRTLNDTQVQQLDAANGGVTPVLISVVTITI
ncbi:MAG TPA: class I lanthipeptide, partial [Myxococcaceae bacterium]